MIKLTIHNTSNGKSTTVEGVREYFHKDGILWIASSNPDTVMDKLSEIGKKSMRPTHTYLVATLKDHLQYDEETVPDLNDMGCNSGN